MANLNLPSTLVLIWDIRRAIEKGQSLSVGIRTFLQRNLNCKFAKNFQKWWDTQKTTKELPVSGVFSVPQRPLVDIVQRGLQGLPIYENLCQLEKEYIQHCEDDIDTHVQKLPLLLQIPLMGFLFPAILMLLIVPALRMLQI